MNNNNKINNIEFCSLYFILDIVSYLGIGVYCTVKAAQTDAYISIILSFIMGFALIFLFFKIWDYEPSLNIFEKNKKLFGKFLGFIINCLFFLIVISLGISGLYNCLTFINSQILPETPLLFLGIIFVIIGIYANKKGIEVIARIAPIIVVINSSLFILAILGLIPTFNLDYLLPFLKDGVMPVFKGSFFTLLQQTIPIFALLVIPKNNVINNTKTKKTVFLAYSFSMLLVFLMIALTIGNLGIDLTNLYSYPEYIVMKKIELFNFIDRIENVLTVQWIFGYIASFNLIVYYLKENIKKESKNFLLLSSLSFTVVILSCFVFKNEAVYAKFIYNYSPIIKIISALLLSLLFIKIVFNKKKNSV